MLGKMAEDRQRGMMVRQQLRDSIFIYNPKAKKANQKCHEQTLENSKSMSSITTSLTRPCLPILLKMLHQLRAKQTNLQPYRGQSYSIPTGVLLYTALLVPLSQELLFINVGRQTELGIPYSFFMKNETISQRHSHQALC